jgi:hypothetical protein
MRCLAALLILQVLLACTLTDAFIQLPDAEVVKRIDRLEFKTCPGCRLNLQPGLRALVHDQVKQGKFPGVTVEFIPSHRPELHYIDSEGKTIGGISVDRVEHTDVEAFLHQLGF